MTVVACTPLPTLTLGHLPHLSFPRGISSLSLQNTCSHMQAPTVAVHNFVRKPQP